MTRLLLLAVPLLVVGMAAGVWVVASRPAPRLDAAPVTGTAELAARLSPPPAAPVAAVGTAAGRRGASRAWVARTASATGIPGPAVRAYADATLRTGREAPGCRLGWTTLAGVGWVESQHGTLGGRRLRPDGRPSRAIYGPRLDGAPGVAALPGTGGGWARAGGPMQFLASTWRQWGSDGDRDGVRDRQDVDDAALAAARYLCASGADLSTGPAWVAAVRSYNHSDDYVRAVYAAAETYASFG